MPEEAIMNYTLIIVQFHDPFLGTNLISIDYGFVKLVRYNLKIWTITVFLIVNIYKRMFYIKPADTLHSVST
jgi:hypothetical protein